MAFANSLEEYRGISEELQQNIKEASGSFQMGQSKSYDDSRDILGWCLGRFGEVLERFVRFQGYSSRVVPESFQKDPMKGSENFQGASRMAPLKSFAVSREIPGWILGRL